MYMCRDTFESAGGNTDGGGGVTGLRRLFKEDKLYIGNSDWS